VNRHSGCPGATVWSEGDLDPAWDQKKGENEDRKPPNIGIGRDGWIAPSPTVKGSVRCPSRSHTVLRDSTGKLRNECQDFKSSGGATDRMVVPDRIITISIFFLTRRAVVCVCVCQCVV
jgi:hypothetical protein